MKKHSGFTLIELMVVMAIIAILATAGLSAYTGYIKKARDATRIADLAAINTIVLSAMASDGLPPTLTQLKAAILAANNGQNIEQPLEVDLACYYEYEPSTPTSCHYLYFLCDGGTGYLLTAGLESASNVDLLTQNTITGWIPALWATNVWEYALNSVYDIGSCVVPDTADTGSYENMITTYGI